MYLTHRFEVKFYVPEESSNYFVNYLDAAHHMNATTSSPSSCKYNLYKVKDRSKYELTKELFVEGN